MNKFEKLVEYIINEDEEQASQLFHEIVVEKSRELYNEIVSEDFDQEVEEADEADDFIDDIEADEEGDMNDMNDMDDDMDDDMGDMDDDMGDMDGDMDDDEVEDRFVDLESAIDELKAEFDAMMGGEDDMGYEPGDDDDTQTPGQDDDDEDMDEDYAFEGDHEDDDDEDDDIDEGMVREYTEKVATPKGEDHKAQSTVAGKNNMGGTVSNIATGGEAQGRPAPTPKENTMGNRNVPGGKAGNLESAPKPKMKAEKSADGSPLNGAPKRAK